jgi:hypothetical protein
MAAKLMSAMRAVHLVRRALALCATVASTLLWTAGSHGAGRPVMAVSFEIDSPTFRRTLEDRAGAEQTLATQLAGMLSPLFSFAEWRAGAAPGSPMGTLVARMVETEASPTPRVEVVWFVRTPSEELVALPLPNVVIYPATNPNWDTGNLKRFQTRVRDEMDPVVRSEGFRRLTFDEVLRKLPIATTVQALPDDHVVVVPLVWKQMRLGQGSEVAVRFTRRSGDGEKHGSLRLAQIGERGRQPGAGFVQGGVKEAVFDAQPLQLDRSWNPALPALLDNATVRCFITTFQSAEFDDAAPGMPILDPQ